MTPSVCPHRKLDPGHVPGCIFPEGSCSPERPCVFIPALSCFRVSHLKSDIFRRAQHQAVLCGLESIRNPDYDLKAASHKIRRAAWTLTPEAVEKMKRSIYHGLLDGMAASGFSEVDLLDIIESPVVDAQTARAAVVILNDQIRSGLVMCNDS